MRWRVVVPGIVLLALVAMLGYGLTRNPRLLPSVLIGHRAPYFHLASLSSPSHALTPSVLKGKVALVNVFASWCVSCRGEVSTLTELSQNADVPILGIDYKDKRDQAERWLRVYGDPYAAIAFDKTGQTGINWGISGVPETFVLDRNGVIRDKVVGPVDDQIMNDRVLPLIRKLRREGT